MKQTSETLFSRFDIILLLLYNILFWL